MAATNTADSPWNITDYARRYDAIVRGDYPFHRQAAHRLVAFAAPQPGQTVLDLGAGTGLVAEEVLRYQPGRLLLSDASGEMLGMARRRLLAGNHPAGADLHFLECDAARLAGKVPEATVDLVVASYAFGWFSDPQRVFSELAKVVKPGGLLVFDVPPPSEPQPRFLTLTPVFQVFSRAFSALLRERLGYAPSRGRTPLPPPDYAAYVGMAQAAGFAVVETLRVEVPYDAGEVEAAWRYGWWFSAAANPALARLDPVKVEAVVEEAIERTQGSREYQEWRASGEPLWETYAALKVARSPR